MDTITVKLASIAAHAEELVGPRGHPVDADAIRGLLADPEVAALMLDLRQRALLPLPR